MTVVPFVRFCDQMPTERVIELARTEFPEAPLPSTEMRSAMPHILAKLKAGIGDATNSRRMSLEHLLNLKDSFMLAATVLDPRLSN